MQNYYNLIDLISCLFVFIIHYPLGRFFGFNSPIKAMLVGLCTSALIVGVLANIYASLIHTYIYISILILFPLFIYSLWQNKSFLSKSALLNYLPILIGFWLIYSLNHPIDSHIQYENGEKLLLFNNHYNYYAAQSIEMLNADYGSRLRVLSVFPFEWAKYHFFNSAAQAILQGLVKTPTIFTYWYAQFLIVAFTILSFIEFALKLLKSNLFYGFAVIGFWFYLGFSFFYHSIVWSLSTSAPFSVFAAFHLVVALKMQRREHIYFFALLLGVSAIRLMPTVAAIVGVCFIKDQYLFAKEFWQGKILAFLFKLRIYIFKYYRVLIFLPFFLIYCLATIKMGTENTAAIFGTGGTYNKGWLWPLTGLNIAALISKTFFRSNYFDFHDPVVFLSRFQNNFFISFVFMMIILIINVLALFFARKKIKEAFDRKLLIVFCLFALCDVGFHYLPQLTCISLGYLWFFYLCSLYTPEDPKQIFINPLTIFVMSIISCCVFVFFAGVNAITSPVFLIVGDVFLWSYLFFVLENSFTIKLNSNRKILLSAMILFVVAFSPAKMHSLLLYGTERRIPLTSDLLSLNEKNHSKNLSAEIYQAAKGDTRVEEAYSIIFGKRIMTNPHASEYRAYEHIAH